MLWVNWVRRLLLFSLLFFFFSSGQGFSHNVSIFAWIEGENIHTESYFQDGTSVKGGKIEVIDSSGNIVHQGITDENGQYSFRFPKYDNITIVLNATMGHRATFEMSKEELKEVYSGSSNVNKEPEKLSSQIEPDIHGRVESPGIEEIRKVVREEVSEQLKPVLRDIARLRNERRITTREIFAGIGYVLGLMGIAMYFKSKGKK